MRLTLEISAARMKLLRAIAKDEGNSVQNMMDEWIGQLLVGAMEGHQTEIAQALKAFSKQIDEGLRTVQDSTSRDKRSPAQEAKLAMLAETMLTVCRPLLAATEKDREEMERAGPKWRA